MKLILHRERILEEVSMDMKARCRMVLLLSPASGKPLSTGVSFRMNEKGKLTGRHTNYKIEIF